MGLVRLAGASEGRCQGWGNLLRSAFMDNTSHVEPPLKGSRDTGEGWEEDGKDASVC